MTKNPQVVEVLSKLKTMDMSDLEEVLDAAANLQDDLEAHPEKRIPPEELASLAKEFKEIKTLKINMPMQFSIELNIEASYQGPNYNGPMCGGEDWAANLEINELEVKSVGKSILPVANIIDVDGITDLFLDKPVKQLPPDIYAYHTKMVAFEKHLDRVAKDIEIESQELCDIVADYSPKNTKQGKKKAAKKKAAKSVS